jgi:hypothetical protein
LVGACQDKCLPEATKQLAIFPVFPDKQEGSGEGLQTIVKALVSGLITRRHQSL